MENKTKEQLADSANGYSYDGKPSGGKYLAFNEGFIVGWDALQHEIDALKEHVNHLLILVENKNALISTLENEKK